MTAGEVAALVLLIGAFLPGVWMCSRGRPQARLVGMEFAGIAATMALTVLSVAGQHDFNLIVPLVMVLIALPATLVYTRLLARKP